MKKLNNNRQAQVKSLDFTNNTHFLYNQQQFQKSPKILQSSAVQVKKEGTLIKKHTGVPKHGLQHLLPVESQHSIRTSPVKQDVIGKKQYPQSIQKASTHKTQKIKIGMHKKAVSLMGGPQQQNLLPFPGTVDQTNLYQYGGKTTSIKQEGGVSLKQSYMPSSQTSFNDYSSTHHNNNYGVGFPKVDNFLLMTTSDPKTGSLLTAHQQQQVKQFQKILQESQLSSVHPSFEQQPQTDLKTFERPPVSQHQSQRLSLASDSIPGGYRSHANSFKGSSAGTSNNVTMKHPPQKYIKGAGTAVATAAGSNDTTTANINYSQGAVSSNAGGKKKTLQFHHQRTFSDNTGSFTNSKVQLFNANATSQISNRNFQELLKSVNNNKDPHLLSDNLIGINSQTQDSYPVIMSNTISGQGLFPAKTTIGSSRQSAQSQALIDERDAMISQYQAHLLSQEKVTDLNQIYQGQFKDQIQNTKQALKLQQQLFGGPSRKVVHNKFMGNGTNTQSYRVSTAQQPTLTTKINGGLTHVPSIDKQTPNYHHKKGAKSFNHSQLGSAQGARTSHNSTQMTLTQQTTLEKQKQKQLKKVEGGGDISLVSVQKVIKPNFHKTSGISNSHKRSASDGTGAVFLSLSNRGIQLQGGGVRKQGSYEMAPELAIKSGQYSQKQSSSKIPIDRTQANTISNEYQIVSERQSYNQSFVIQQQQPNLIVNSHRKILNEQPNKHIRHNSDQIHQQDQLPIRKNEPIQSQRPFQPNKIVIQKNQKGDPPYPMINPHNITPLTSTTEMIILDQQQQSKKQSMRVSEAHTPIKLQQEIKQNTFYNPTSHTVLKPVEERIETQESVVSDPNLTPRSRMNMKLSKKIKQAFSKPGPSQGVKTSIEFYKIGKVMGKGAFGKVNLAIHRLSNKFVALKSINKTFLSEEASQKKVMQEFNILRRTRHVNIVRLYESFETAQHIVFVMEVCGAGDLLTYVRRRRKLKEDVAKHMFKQIIEGLRYCHSKCILHRDIKLDNILLTSEGDIRICDFGVSKLVKPGEIMTEQCGTPAYIAPEVFEGRGYEGYSSDVWSAGVVLYAMLYGTVPFKANNMTELQKQITKCQTSFKEEISPDAINLLKSILERDPAKRLKTHEILRHPWMQDIEKVQVFTEQEKDKVISEFAYYNFKQDLGNDEVVHTDPFTEQMLNSTQNSLIKNASTKSVILAPFNSTRSNIDENFHMRKSVQELLIDKKNIKFAPKVKEVDRQYEANNNAELDNGVYHQDSDEEEEKKAQDEEKQDQEQKKRDLEDGDNDEYGQKKQSEWQKLEKMVIENQKTEDEEEERTQKQRLMNMQTALTLVIDERLVADIEGSGFPKSYIVNSLNNDEMNYVTTYYYLLTTQKEY